MFYSDFRDTWQFLDGRVKDSFDLSKTYQEVFPLAFSFVFLFFPFQQRCHNDLQHYQHLCWQAKYLAEAVTAGMGITWPGFMKKAFYG